MLVRCRTNCSKMVGVPFRGFPLFKRRVRLVGFLGITLSYHLDTHYTICIIIGPSIRWPQARRRHDRGRTTQWRPEPNSCKGALAKDDPNPYRPLRTEQAPTPCSHYTALPIRGAPQARDHEMVEERGQERPQEAFLSPSL